MKECRLLGGSPLISSDVDSSKLIEIEWVPSPWNQ